MGILSRGEPPGSSNPVLTLFHTKKCHFPHLFFFPDLLNPYPFSDLAFRQKLCYHYLDYSENKKIPQIRFEFAYFSFFLTSLEFKR